MAKKPQNKNAAAAANLAGASVLFVSGFCAELYLLVLQRFFVNGTVKEIALSSYVVEALMYVGLALFAAGAVLKFLRRASGGSRLANWLLGIGVFFAAANKAMLSVYPDAAVSLCIIVPIVLIVGVAFFLYQREFFFSLCAMVLSVGACWLCSKGLGNAKWEMIVIAASVVVLLLIAALFALSLSAAKKKGIVELGGRKFRMLSVSFNRTLLYGAYILSALAVIAALLGCGYYCIWVLCVVIFALAVYYTIKMM
ncbi:MAG: hypothetical protein IJF15_04505 [Oscillospiraceae bacterium]|nr:hypothetical protein [Oscillospiraceae bacterium]